MKILFECHDCDIELNIIDNTQSVDIDDIVLCPVCGSKNIYTSKK